MLHTARSLRRELQRDKTNKGQHKNTKERWRGKRMQVQFPYKLDKKLVENEQSYRWLTFGDIKGETESTSGSSITSK
jgi:hypothetical protein